MSVINAFDSTFEKYAARGSRQRASRLDSVGALESHLAIQQALRPLFGKVGASTPSIGDHPDFNHLRGTDVMEHCAITTMFMDMEGSTRLGLIHPPEDVVRIKNAFIRSAIDVVKSFDGHVHRIMGDAVMAYFGRRSGPPEQGAIDALNCAAVLRAFVDHLAGTKYKSAPDEALGIRVGLDFAPADKIVWASYGYPGMEEVTATSFHVDIASKLQNGAGRNQIAIGDALRLFLDFPEELLEVDDPRYISYQIRGQKNDYRRFLLKWEKYLACTAIATAAPELIGRRRPSLIVRPSLFDEQVRSAASVPYSAASKMLPKDKWLGFDVELPFEPRGSYTITHTIENHGAQAETEKRDDDKNLRRSETTAVTDPRKRSHWYWEHTSYRGLHYFTIDVSHPGGKESLRTGVYIA